MTQQGAREIPSYADAPEPLTDREKALLQRIFSDFMEVPGDWFEALKRKLEQDPPILGKATLGAQSPSGPLGPNSVTTGHIVDGTIIANDVNPVYKDGAQNVPSLRTLGTGHLQAAAGDDPRFIDLTYDGAYPAAGPYTDGDIVVYGGVAYLCVRPTSGPPAPWPTPSAGGGDLTYVHTQGTPSPNWTVTHNLAKYPAVEVVDSGNNVIIPDVHYVDPNTLGLAFGASTSGKAYVN